MKKRFYLFIATLGLLLSTVLSGAGLGSTAFAVVDNTPDCDNVAVIRCGAFSMGAMREKAAQGDVPRIFNAVGISQNDLKGTFVNGVVWRDGRVTVGDTVVATGAKTAGRNFGGSPISGTNAGIYSTNKFVTEGQTAFVKMVNGEFKFAVVKACGNPVVATPKPQPKPSFQCIDLRVDTVNNSRTKRHFTAHATASGGATIEQYEFGFGDGFGITVANNSYTYNYKKAGTFHTSVVVHIKVNDKIKKVTAPTCEQTVTVAPEEKPAVSITKTVDGVKQKTVGINQQFTYQLVVTNNGNTELRNSVVSDKAPTGVTFVTANVGTITNDAWTYTVPSLAPGKSLTVTITATIPAHMAGNIVNTACVDSPQIPGNPDDCDTATVTVPTPGQVTVCNPETGETISVSETDAGKYKPVNDAACQPKPEALPSTGPEAIITGFMGTSALGYGAYSYFSSRRTLIDKFLKR